MGSVRNEDIGKAIPSEDFPGFFQVPGKKDIFIDRQGRVVDGRRLYCPYPYPHDGYWYYREGSMHRMLALTFLPIPKELWNESRLEVNHIDSDRSNGDLANLEWVTRSGNSRHAVAYGKRTDNHRVMVKDMRDGTIARFPSIGECARAMGLTAAHIHYYLSARARGKVHRRHFVFIYDGENWPEIGLNELAVTSTSPVIGVFAQHLESGKSVIFDGVSSAGTYLQIPPWKVRHVIRSASSQIWNGWHLRELDDLTVFAPMDIIRRKPHKKIGNKNPLPVLVTDMRSMKTVEWDSVEAFAHDCGVKKKTIQKSMGRKGGMWKYYRFVYKDRLME